MTDVSSVVSPSDRSVIDWRRILREQAEQGLPDDLRDEEGSLLSNDGLRA